MELKFKCSSCKEVFASNGKKNEWMDSTYGMCWKYVADCPQCGAESNEYRASNSKKNSCNSASCHSGSCGSCGCS
jgi:hypothetical protein